MKTIEQQFAALKAQFVKNNDERLSALLHINKLTSDSLSSTELDVAKREAKQFLAKLIHEKET